MQPTVDAYNNKSSFNPSRWWPYLYCSFNSPVAGLQDQFPANYAFHSMWTILVCYNHLLYCVINEHRPDGIHKLDWTCNCLCEVNVLINFSSFFYHHYSCYSADGWHSSLHGDMPALSKTIKFLPCCLPTSKTDWCYVPHLFSDVLAWFCHAFILAQLLKMPAVHPQPV